MLVPDLNWLPHSLFKGISYPTVEYEDLGDQSYGGYYTTGTGKILIVADDTEASTIAHEVRHYLQDISGLLDDKGSSFEVEGSYEDSITRYFLTQPTEFDALLFEYKYAKSWLNEWWLEKLVLGN